MKERPIIFTGEMVRAILDVRKSVTRRVIKPQPDTIYSFTDDSIRVYHSNHGYRTEKDTGSTERRLPSWIRRKDLFMHQIRWIWSQGTRGLVPIEGTSDSKGVPDNIDVPRKPESYQSCTPSDLFRISRETSETLFADEALKWEPGRQSARKSRMGDTSRELGRSENPREGNRRRETSDVKIDRQGTGAYTLGCQQGIVQPATCGTDTWYVSGGNIRRMPWQVNTTLWVRETFNGGEQGIPVAYRATEPELDGAPWKPSIFMPRRLSRITLEVTDIRVERVQDISWQDVMAEGIATGTVLQEPYPENPVWIENVTDSFRQLWDSINAKRGYGWDKNPYCWVIDFMRIEP